MMASSETAVDAQCFHEVWTTLGKRDSAVSERASSYQTLATYLKGDVTQDFVSALSKQHKTVIQSVMDDITGRTCPQEAIQLLGYCLFTPQFAEACGADAGKIIGVLCTVPYDKATEKSVITRALWCLSSQNFHSEQITHSIPQIITLATDIIMEYGFGSLAVEALNVFLRINQQCPKEFGLVASMWYKGIIILLECKVAKFQRKAYNFAVPFESSIASNNYLVGYLTKELKEHIISSMIGYMEERGKDPILILNIWSHFVSVLGHALHRHSSFLNEMLRVVELGFKHKVFLVQVAAYSSWKMLIDNFSIDMELLTQQRRLKLLLMPLLASAVKDRHEQVEVTRLQTWWHLIRTLGPNREQLFHQVCIPFLLFCLGVDPKMDLSKLPSILSELAPTPSRGALHMAKTSQVSQNKENVPTSDCPTGRTAKTPSGQGFQMPGSLKAGRLLTLLSNSSMSSSGKKSDRYQNTPKLPLVLSGCHALLQFLAFEEKLPGSLLDADDVCVVYRGAVVPTNVLQFLVAFLDGAMLYMVHYSKEVKGSAVEYLVRSLFTVFLHTLRQEGDTKSAAHLAVLLVGMLKCEAVISHVSTGTRLDILNQFINLPPAITTIICNTHGSLFWCGVAQELIAIAPNKHSNPIFLNGWTKLLELSTSHVHATLTTFGDLCDLLDRFVELVVPENSKRQQLQLMTSLSKMWSSLAQDLISFVKETSQMNEGTTLSPDFSVARRILKFPFRHNTFHNAEKQPMISTFETWKELYDIFHIHTSLVVKDPNHCAELVCRDLYDSYGQNVRSDSATLDKGETITFDQYQNIIGLALTHVLTKFNWTSLKALVGERETAVGGVVHVGGRGGEMEVGGKGGKCQKETASKNLQSLIGLLSWQLATLWDTVQRSPLHIGNLTSPYTLMETVTLLYGNLSTSDLIHSTTEMLAQPMVTLWQNVLDSDHEPAGAARKSLYKGPFDLPERIIKTWKSILTCFRNKYTSPFNSEILSALSPLLVFALSSTRQDLANMTLGFWKTTFDSAEHLVYPNKLRDIFVKFKQSDILLKLPGFEVSQNVQHALLEDRHVSDSVVTAKPPQTTADSSRDSAILVPHPSPQKGVRGSFLGQKRSPKPSTPPRSPAAQAMDEILARSHARQQVTGHSTDSSVAKSPALSARRRLSLNTAKEDDFVAVEPPAKRQQLLTEHQKEKLHERNDSIPPMYNALDPSQDATQCTAQPSIPDSALEEPIIIPESEGSPATAVSTRPIARSNSSENAVGSVKEQSTSDTTPSQSLHAAEYNQTVVSFPPSVGCVSASSVVAAAGVGTSMMNISGMQVQMQLGHGHIRTSPIASRTRSRLRPGLGTPSSVPFPIPTSGSCELPSYQSHLWSFRPHAVSSTGQVVARPQPDAATLSPVVSPSSMFPQHSTVTTRSPFSPTDRHYQSLHAQQIHPMNAGPMNIERGQQVYQMHYSTTSGSIVIPLPLHQQIGTMGGQLVQGTRSLEQFVPVRSLATPIVNPPMQSSTTSAQSSQLASEPTFPTARYIIRPPSNQLPPPPPYPSGPHSPVQLHRGQSVLQPLPLSAAVRPKLPGTRHFKLPTKVTQQLPTPPAISALLLTAQPALPVTGDSVDSPIVIEDVEDPLTGTTTSRIRRTVEPAMESVSESQNISPESNSERELSAVQEVQSKDGQAKQTVLQHVPVTGRVGTVAVTGQQEEEDMEVQEVERETNRDQDDTSRQDTGRAMGSDGNDTVTSGASGPGKDDTGPCETSVEPDDGPQAMTVEESPIESESMSESCQPGPALLDPAVFPASEGFDPSNDPSSTAEPNKTGDRKQEESESGQVSRGPDVNETSAREVAAHACIEGVSNDQQLEDIERVCADTREETSCENEAEPQTFAKDADTHTAMEDTEKQDIHSVVGIHNAAGKQDTHHAAGNQDTAVIQDTEVAAEKQDTHGAAGKQDPAVIQDTHDAAVTQDTEVAAEKQDTAVIQDTHDAAVIQDTHDTAVIQDTQVAAGKQDPAVIQDTHDAAEKQLLPETERVSLAVGETECEVADVSPVRNLGEMLAVPVTPTNEVQGENFNSPKTTPGGILKHTSQFDTPTASGGKVRRVQFASSPVVFESSKAEEEGFKTPKHSRARTQLSSRRTLLKSDPNSRVIQVNKSPSTSTEPVYPSLTGCDSPVEDILPVLSPSRRFTHGLVHLVHARNIRTVGNISSLTEQQVQTLPIKTPKIESLKQALRNYQHQLGTKRRASVEADYLGPPAKAQKQDSTSPPEGDGLEQVSQTRDISAVEKEVSATGDKEDAMEREDGNSQLSLASQSSQIEPAVVLSSPTNASDSANIEQSGGEPMKADVLIDDDDVFMDETRGTNITGIDKDTAECSMEDELVVETERALERACPSPPMSVRSPEIPLQSSPSRTEPTLSPAVTEDKSVRDSVSSEESGEMDVEMEQGEAVVSDADSIGQSQQQNNLEHDHPYHLLSQQNKPCNVQSDSTWKCSNFTSEHSSTVPVVTSAELADHSYCSMTTTSPLQTATVTSAPQQYESNSDQTVTDLRSKLSSDVQDHNYCRLPTPNSTQTAIQTAEAVVCEAETAGDDDAGKISESQELFSVSEHEEEISVGDNQEPSDADPSFVHVTSRDVGSHTENTHTENTELAQDTTYATLANKSIADSLKSVIDSMSAQEDLSSSMLWKVHRELVRGLSIVSDKLSSDSF